jgi:AraC family transcriptional regulator
MLETVAKISAPNCRFELLRGHWPHQVEMPTLSSEPILSTMFVGPNRQVEARVAGRAWSDFGPLGATFMLPPDRQMIGRSNGGAFRAARCFFRLEAYRDLVPHGCELDGAELERALDLGNQTIALLMRRLMQEAASPGFASEAVVEAIATVMLVECGRHISPSAPSESQDARHRLSTAQLRLVERRMDEWEPGAPSVADLAAICGYSPNYFSKLFRQATGQSVSRYIADWRLRRAQQLLGGTQLPLKEIAFRLGFANAANFSTAFSKETGQTPGAYRRESAADRTLWN